MDYFLGYVIKPGTWKLAHTINAIYSLQASSNITELCSLLGLCNVFRWFLPNFARTTAPPNCKLGMDHTGVYKALSDEELNALYLIQQKPTSSPGLALPRSWRTYRVEIDACDRQVGCVLLQKRPNGHDTPICYWSRSVTDAESSYDATHGECFAVVWAILLLLPYIESTSFAIWTDQDALTWTQNLVAATGKLA